MRDAAAAARHRGARDPRRLLRLVQPLLRARQRPFLEYRATGADEVDEPLRIDVPLQELARGRLFVDIDFVQVDAGRIQKTSGILAGGSGRLGVKGHGRHARILNRIP